MCWLVGWLVGWLGERFDWGEGRGGEVEEEERG
jgi:hypothetical protein